MPRQYPQEFRERIVAVARSGRSVSEISSDYGVAGATVYRWLDQDRIDHGEKPGAGGTGSDLVHRWPSSSGSGMGRSGRRLGRAPPGDGDSD